MSALAEGSLTIRELVTKLGFDFDESKLKGFERGMETAKALGEALTVIWTGVVGTLAEVTRETAEYGEEIQINSELLGISTEKFQKLRYAAQAFGIENESIITAVRFFNKTLGEMQQGMGEGGKAFHSLGFSMAELKNQPIDKMLERVADRLHGIADPARRAALSAELFGRSGAHFGQFLAQGSQVVGSIGEQLDGLYMTPAQVEAGQKAHAALIQIKAVVTLLRNEVGVRLFPEVERLSKAFLGWVTANKELIKTNIDKYLHLVTDAIALGWRWMARAVEAVKALTGYLGGLDNALKLVAVSLGAIFSARILGSLMEGIKDLRELGLVGLLDSAEILLVPAAILGVILALDDLRGWLKGDDSVLGSLVGPFSEMRKQFDRFTLPFEHIKEEFGKLRDSLKNVWGDLFHKNGSLHELLAESVPKLFRDSEDVFVNAGEIMGNAILIGIRLALFKPLQAVMKALPTATAAASGGPIGMLLQLLGNKGASSVWDNGITPFVKRGAALPNVGQFYDQNSVAYPSASGPAGGGGNINTHVTLEMPPGTPQSHLDYVKQGAKAIFQTMFNQELFRLMQQAPAASP